MENDFLKCVGTLVRARLHTNHWREPLLTGN